MPCQPRGLLSPGLQARLPARHLRRRRALMVRRFHILSYRGHGCRAIALHVSAHACSLLTLFSPLCPYRCVCQGGDPFPGLTQPHHATQRADRRRRDTHSGGRARVHALRQPWHRGSLPPAPAPLQRPPMAPPPAADRGTLFLHLPLCPLTSLHLPLLDPFARGLHKPTRLSNGWCRPGCYYWAGGARWEPCGPAAGCAQCGGDPAGQWRHHAALDGRGTGAACSRLSRPVDWKHVKAPNQEREEGNVGVSSLIMEGSGEGRREGSSKVCFWSACGGLRGVCDLVNNRYFAIHTDGHK